MPLVDLSHPITTGMQVYPGAPEMEVLPVLIGARVRRCAGVSDRPLPEHGGWVSATRRIRTLGTDERSNATEFAENASVQP